MTTNPSETAPASDMNRTLGLFSATAIVIGSMVGSGIFLVSPETARYMGTETGMIWLWVLTGVITLFGAASYGKLAAHMPEAGGQYVFLRECWGKIPAFLYGWVFFWVIQTGSMAAVAVAFARYVGVLWPAINTQAIAALPFGLSLTTEKLLAATCLLFLTWFNTQGVESASKLQNIFTTLKVLALLVLIVIGFALGHHLWAGHVNLFNFTVPTTGDIGTYGLMPILAVAAVGPLFSSDAWCYVTFIGGEVKNPSVTLPKALVLGAGAVVVLYVLANLAYLNVLPMDVIAHAPDDKVAATMMTTLFGPLGGTLIAIMILVSTFGCLNGMIMSGARVFYAMACDGLLFKPFAQLHPVTKTPNVSLWAQFGWGVLLAMSGSYSTLLAFIIFTALVFYVLTIGGLLKLAQTIPQQVRMTRWTDYLIPIGYIVGASVLSAYLLVAPQTQQTSLIGAGFTLLGLPVFLIWQAITNKK
ncbi:MAG: amino acid permease [Vampirovibrionales bacterium]|nr:amino acid permease [Vampirovibrionales bacterium]